MEISLPIAEKAFGMCLTVMSIGPLKLIMKENFKCTNLVMVLFAISIALHLGLFVYVRRQILLVNNQNTFNYVKTNLMDTETIEIKVVEYDLEECDKHIKSVLFNAVVNVFFAYKFEKSSSIFSSIIGFINPLLFNGLIREYLYGKSLSRPFDKVSIFGKSIRESALPDSSASSRSERRRSAENHKSNSVTSDVNTPGEVQEIIESDSIQTERESVLSENVESDENSQSSFIKEE